MFCHVNGLPKKIFMEWIEERHIISDSDQYDHYTTLFFQIQRGKFRDKLKYRYYAKHVEDDVLKYLDGSLYI